VLLSSMVDNSSLLIWLDWYSILHAYGTRNHPRVAQPAHSSPPGLRWGPAGPCLFGYCQVKLIWASQYFQSGERTIWGWTDHTSRWGGAAPCDSKRAAKWSAQTYYKL